MVTVITQPRPFAVHGTQFDALVAPSTGSTENSVWIVTLAPGTEGAPHAMTREEIFIALDGAAEVMCAGERYELRAGAALILPAHVEFSLANRSDVPFRAVAVLPVGGRARLADGSILNPPWAQ